MSLSLILIPYGLLLAIFAIFSIVSLLHLVRYGSRTFFSFFVTFIYLAGTVLLLYSTATLLADTDWTAPLFEFAPNVPSLGL
ncbi:hypothetical protein A3F28_02540 [Candidatus Uhrbacteria bacterium RIFCSPHIGHO2_12_FULL_57_11]|uniref:Uncharacterized protein n=1 Tax=Candidatus Uhrbacteria bacterium RIFCSPHIGHO2_12_FULL_57_11 TaxID=1802398 RepID=A0A1F7UKB7_9BACT|nr:MAG: hypothetical protein A3F28_02540 [Candidatus Uhrbacteria bacterium RIFCSPHIGHO2_12_FULL_57_11]